MSRALPAVVSWVLGAVLGLGGCGHTAERRERIESDQRYAAAERAYSGRRDTEADRLFEEVAATGDVEAAALSTYRRAQIRERAGDFEGALAMYRAAEVYPAPERRAFAGWRIARIYLEKQGKRAEGRAALQALIDRWPDASASDRAAKYLAIRRSPEEAADRHLDREMADWLRAAAERHAGHSVADNLLFWAAYAQVYRLGDVGGARTTLSAMVERYYVSPLLDDGLWLLGAIERRQGRLEAALAAYEAILHIREDQNYLIMGYRSRRLDDAAIGVALVQHHLRGDLPAAARAYQRLLDEFPTTVFRDDAWWGLACVQQLQGQVDASRKSLRAFVAELPDSRYAKRAQAILDGKAECPPPDPALARTPLLHPQVKGEM